MTPVAELVKAAKANQPTPTGLALLRMPFPANQISKKPKPYKKDSPKGKCNECGGYHGLPAVHLDYVGHAVLTDRLLDADPHWTWEPVADPKSLGLPASDGGMWIRLTVCGVTRLGFGCADGKSGGDAVKEMIGDALRNAAMRFGAALDLWHKGNLHEDEDADDPAPVAEPLKRIQLPAGTYQVLEAKSAQWGGEVVVVDANGEEHFHKTTDKQVLDFCKVNRLDAVPVTLEFEEITRGVNKGKQKLVGVHRWMLPPVVDAAVITADEIPF